VAQHLTDAVAATRRAVQAQLGADDAEFGRTWKDVLVRNEADLPAAEWLAVTTIKAGIPELARVHTLKEDFRAIFEAPLERATAAERVEAWLGQAHNSGLAALEEFARFVEH